MTTAIDDLINLSINLVISEQGNIHNFSVFQQVLESVLRGREPMEDIVRVTTHYTATVGNGTIFVDATAAPVTITLPSTTDSISFTAGTAKPITVKKIDASAHAVTLVPSGADTIEGLSSFPLGNQDQCITLVSDGTDWNITADNYGASGTSPSISHSALLNLDADDHLQYLLVDGTRAMAAALNMGGFAISSVGTVDGRDVSVDGAKLDTIPTLPTSDGSYVLKRVSTTNSWDTALLGPGTVTADTLAQYSGTSGKLLKQGPALGTAVGNIPQLIDVGGTPGFDVLSGANLLSLPYPVYPAEVRVFSESDLPAASGGVITLASNTMYRIYGTVALTAGNRIVLPPGSALIGQSATFDIITGSYAGSLITVLSPSATASSQIWFISVVNTSANVAAACIEINAPSATTAIDHARLICASGTGILVTSSGNMSIYTSTITAGIRGINVVGVCSGISMATSAFIMTAANAVGLNIAATATLSALTLTFTGVITTAASQTGIVFNAGAASVTAYIFRCILQGSGTFNSGWDQGTSGWNVRGCPSLPDSAAGGGSSSTGVTITVPTTVLNAWVDVSQVGQTPYILDAGSERVSLVSSANGEVRYTGSVSRRFVITGMVSASKVSGGGTTNDYEMQLAINGNLNATAHAVSTLSTGVYGQISTKPIAVVLNPNDTIKCQIRNISGTSAITVHTGGVTLTPISL